MLQTIEGVASPAECEALITAARAADVGDHPAIHRHGSATTIYPELFPRDTDAYWVLCDRVTTLLQAAYDPSLTLDCGLVVRLEAGAGHTLHADAELEDGAPNHTAHRKATGLLYLTTSGEEFEGGELVVAEQKTITPRAGLLVAMPTTWDYRHEVHPVRSGERWSLNIWMQ